ncbi:MAG: dihydroxyacetone kinase subunit L [Curvibacter sp.]|nr:dihydroxyacetone kinase subunit L [Curvibacter sp.]
MNRVINHPDHVVDDMLKGWISAHADALCRCPANPRVVQGLQTPHRGKVGVITGGGSGHEPAFLGYLGPGLLDAVAVGEVFSSPTARSFLDAMRAADGGAGVACLYGNYAGDNMNVRMAIEMAEREGRRVGMVVANDDVASAPKGQEALRRGVAGEILMWKAAAACADLGGSLEEVIAVAQKAMDRTRSIGIGLSSCVIPAVGKANFHIEPGQMEVGIGHHGEPGLEVCPVVPAAEMAGLMLDRLLPDLPFEAGDRVAVVVSGLGATPLMEQYILYGEVAQQLAERGITAAVRWVGPMFTSLEMMGVTLTLMRLDDELARGLLAPCQSVALSVPGLVDSRAAHSSDGASGPRQDSPSVPLSVAALVLQERGAGLVRSWQGVTLASDTAGAVVRDLIDAVVAHRQVLSEIDGLIGDGDHGINMAKGFGACAIRLDALGAEAESLPVALQQLSQALMEDIGGSMGPLYGQFFLGLASVLAPHDRLDARLFGEALAHAVAQVQQMGRAQVGDKTLLDTLVPALEAYQAGLEAGRPFGEALQRMSEAAGRGRDSTRDLQARVGRAARLGARSKGVLDAGATSACLILQTMAGSLQAQLGFAVG